MRSKANKGFWVSCSSTSPSIIASISQSGTLFPKKVAPKAIPYNSPRQDRPLVSVNCSAIPKELLESELFGHLKGAFTGAIANKRGLFEEADGSSLFLDEISELSPELQVKLLRVIQEGELKRVGDTRTMDTGRKFSRRTCLPTCTAGRL
jgi:transcriptional regulator with GAF, ATPase, and Fis domain